MLGFDDFLNVTDGSTGDSSVSFVVDMDVDAIGGDGNCGRLISFERTTSPLLDLGGVSS